MGFKDGFCTSSETSTPSTATPSGAASTSWRTPAFLNTASYDAMGVKENERLENGLMYLVLPLAHQDHRRVPHRVLHDLLHLTGEGRKASEITKKSEKI